MSLDRFERAILDSAHREMPDPARKDAARRAMLEAAGVGAIVAAATTTTTKAAVASTTATKAASVLTAAKLVKLALVVTALAGGGIVAARLVAQTNGGASDAPHVLATPALPRAIASGAEIAPSASAARTFVPADLPSAVAEAAPTARPSEAPRAADRTAPSGDDPLATEAKLLARARDALASGDRNGAKTTLREHETRFPKGALGNEAEVLAIDLALANGDRADARRRAGLLLARDPKSPYRARLLQLTEATP